MCVHCVCKWKPGGGVGHSLLLSSLSLVVSRKLSFRKEKKKTPSDWHSLNRTHTHKRNPHPHSYHICAHVHKWVKQHLPEYKLKLSKTNSYGYMCTPNITEDMQNVATRIEKPPKGNHIIWKEQVKKSHNKPLHCRSPIPTAWVGSEALWEDNEIVPSSNCLGETPL